MDAAELAVDNAAWEAWERAWNEARDADRAAGRRYDKDRYAEAAHDARIAVLRRHYGTEIYP